MVAAHQTANTLFWQFVNQAYNAMFNYSNRNAAVSADDDQESTVDEMAWRAYYSPRASSLAWLTASVTGSFGIATSVACGVSLALNVVVKRATNLTPTVRNLVQRVCCSADFAHAG